MLSGQDPTLSCRPSDYPLVFLQDEAIPGTQSQIHITYRIHGILPQIQVAVLKQQASVEPGFVLHR